VVISYTISLGVAEAEDRQEQRLSQARLIAAWEGFTRAQQDSADPERSGIQLVNGSPEPVYNVFACVVFTQGAAPYTSEGWFDCPCTSTYSSITSPDMV
jgi:hypothetical protein